MFSKRSTRQNQDATGLDGNGTGSAAAPSSPASFKVLIRGDGSVELDGHPFSVPEDEVVHVVLLDEMHLYAQQKGGPVEMEIIDRQEGYTARIEVAPDGSSEILDHEKHEEDEPYEEYGEYEEDEPYDGDDRYNVQLMPAVELPSTDLAAPSSEVGLLPPDAPEAVSASSPPPVDVPPPHAGTPPAGPLYEEPRPVVSMPVSIPIPDEFAELVDLIGQAVDTGALERASALAFRLRRHAVRAFGAEHAYTLEALSLEAFVAHKSGNHRFALETCLELARLRRLQGDPRALEELKRAIAAWRLLDGVPSAVEYGRTLLAVWSEVAESDGPETADTELADRVNRRMQTLVAKSDAGRAGAA